MKKFYLTYFIFLTFGILCNSFAQDIIIKNDLTKQNEKTSSLKAFNRIEEGIISGNVKTISNFLNSHTYFSLANGTNGYYSSNQAFYVLQDFFNLYKVTSFKLKNINSDDSNPYATGIYSYEYQGKRETARVYISLKKAADDWKITQLTIY